VATVVAWALFSTARFATVAPAAKVVVAPEPKMVKLVTWSEAVRLMAPAATLPALPLT
jgi:hypothetical protein